MKKRYRKNTIERAKRYFYTLLAVACLAAGAEAAREKPNLIVIMADDLGYGDVGYNGCSDIPTPHIDALAKSGVQFSSGYSAYSVCGPSRAGFITGRYQQRFGSERNPQYRPDDPNMGLPESEQTIAEVLKPVGYTSKIIGKWHLGAHKETHHPLNRGFDEFYGHLGGSHFYLQKKMKYKGSSYEGGYRVPFLMQWKGVAKPSIYDCPVSSLDVLATIAELSGAPLNAEKPLDGVNLIPYLTGAKQGPPHEAIFLRGGGAYRAYG